MKKKNIMNLPHPNSKPGWVFGFSLIELLVVISIIGVLSAAGVVSFTSVNKTARDGKRKADLEQLRAALVLYRTDNPLYPSTLTWNADGEITQLYPNYLNSTTVKDPKPSPYTQYTYTYNALSNTFTVCAMLETTNALTCLANP